MNLTPGQLFNRKTILSCGCTMALAILCPTALGAQDVSLHVKNASVSEAIAALNREHNYSLVAKSSKLDLSRRVTVAADNESIDRVLNQIFAGQDVSYHVDGKVITVNDKTSPAPQATASAQQQKKVTLKGKVLDAKKEPVIGASVVIAGTTVGTVTDYDGNFSIPDVSLPADVTCSYVGYETKKIRVTSAAPLNITLSENSELLDEVVVVGYGTQRKANLTGAVSSISGKDINNRPVISAANALQGADPSVNLTLSTGSPDAGYSVNIRGAISINSSSPLVLADGIEVSLSQINPNDIESISVLKDASSCAIYGAKASAGVILITTKKGSSTGNMKITYSGRGGWAKNTTTTDFITTGYDHVTLTNRFYNATNGVNMFQYTEANGGLEKLYERRNDKTENPDRPWVEIGDDGKYYYYGNTDWYGFFYNRVRPQQEHNVTLSGGNDKLNFYASGRYLDQDGIFKITPDVYKDYSFRAKVEAKIYPWLKYSNNINYDKSSYTYAGCSDYNKTVATLQSNITPAFVPYNPDGSIVQYTNQLYANSPLGAGVGGFITSDVAHNTRDNRYLIINNQFDITVFKDLVVTANYGYRTRDRLYKYRNNTFEYSRAEGVMQTFTSGTVKNSYEEINYGYTGQMANIYGTYNHTWNKAHNFTATVGGQYDKYRSTSLDITQLDLTSDKLSSFAVATGTSTITQSISTYKTLGFFGRLNYDYLGKYLVEFSMRGDGSSRFASNSRWGYFPSFSLGWRMSEEKFFEPVSDWWNNLKVRFSYGTLGNQQVSSYYAYIDQISIDNVMNYTFDGLNKANYASVTDPISSGLTWEKVITDDWGLDMSFLNSRLTFTGDYYIRDTKDMLTTSLTLPSVYGANTPKANCANLRTKGWEITVGWNDKFSLFGKPFTYNVSGSVGDYITKITKYYNPNRVLSDYYVGKTLGEIWGYQVEGLFKTDKEAAEYQASINDKAVNQRVYNCKGEGLNKLRAGDVKFIDANGDGVISQGAGTVDNPGDQKVIGNNLPRYNYSFRVGFNWHDIDVSAFFQGVGKRNWFPANGQSSYDFWGPYAFPSTSFIAKGFEDNCWTEDNRNAYFPRQRGYQAYSSGALGVNNDRYLQNVAYLRFKNLTVGYTLPVLKKYIDRIRVYFDGENLCYWSPLKKYCKTVDPELCLTTASYANNSGVGYNYSRTFSFGVDIQF